MSARSRYAPWFRSIAEERQARSRRSFGPHFLDAFERFDFLPVRATDGIARTIAYLQFSERRLRDDFDRFMGLVSL